jgi:hypothetical protein
MTSKNQAVKEAAAPWIELFAKGIAAARTEGMSEAKIEAALEQVERDIAWTDPDVRAVVIGELRKSIGLK